MQKMMKGRTFLLAAVLLALACEKTTDGPQPPRPEDIVKARVRPVSGSGKASTVTDPNRLRGLSQSYALSRGNWSVVQEDLVPEYRIDLDLAAGDSVTYWLGANANRRIFPCYSLCSGWWIAASTQAHALDNTRLKKLPDSVYLRFSTYLGIR